jgi:hypothetical protein
VAQVLWLLAVTGCSADHGYAVLLTIHRGSIPAAQVAALTVQVNGAESFGPTRFDSGRLFAPDGDAGWVYKPSVRAGQLTFAVTAEAADGSLLASAVTTPVVLRYPGSVQAELTLGPLPTDLGVSDTSSPDLAGVPQDAGSPWCSGPPTCGAPGVRLCDSFEGTIYSVWDYEDHNGAQMLDPMRACRGSDSAYFSTPPISGDAGATDYVEAELVAHNMVTSSPVYLRAFVWLGAGFVGLVDGVGLLEVKQGSAPYQKLHLGLYAGYLRVRDDFDNIYLNSTLPVGYVLSGGWVCLELRVSGPLLGGSGANQVQVWRDGAEVTELAVNQAATAPSPLATSLRIGIADQPVVDTPKLEAWFDDVVVDGQPIGCAR